MSAADARKVKKALDAALRFIGKGGRAFRNEAGDLVVLSNDGLREIRFDFNNPAPHQHSHVHVIEYRRVKNSKVVPCQASMDRWHERKTYCVLRKDAPGGR